jgi:hypothetical protein
MNFIAEDFILSDFPLAIIQTWIKSSQNYPNLDKKFDQNLLLKRIMIFSYIKYLSPKKKSRLDKNLLVIEFFIIKFCY